MVNYGRIMQFLHRRLGGLKRLVGLKWLGGLKRLVGLKWLGGLKRLVGLKWLGGLKRLVGLKWLGGLKRVLFFDFYDHLNPQQMNSTLWGHTFTTVCYPSPQLAANQKHQSELIHMRSPISCTITHQS